MNFEAVTGNTKYVAVFSANSKEEAQEQAARWLQLQNITKEFRLVETTHRQGWWQNAQVELTRLKAKPVRDAEEDEQLRAALAEMGQYCGHEVEKEYLAALDRPTI